MAQLRQDYELFRQRGAEVIVAGPDSPEQFARYFRKNDLPFVGIPDPGHAVLKLFGQQVNIFKLGRMPGQVIIDKSGIVRYVHYGHDMTDIPSSDEMLEILNKLNSEQP